MAADLTLPLFETVLPFMFTSTPDPGIRKHTPRLAGLISAVWTLGCRYWFRVGHWNVVAHISSTEPATTSQCTRNDIPTTTTKSKYLKSIDVVNSED